MYETIIVGGGPAGMTAGIYLARAGVKTLIIEKEAIGGQIATSPIVENYPGYLKINGAELAINMYEQAKSAGVDFEFEDVIQIKDGKIKTVKTESNEYQAKAIIIATGAKYRRLGLEDEERLIGRGIHFCTSCDAAFYKGKIVAVIGGANSAVTNAIHLSGIAQKVYLIYRGKELKCEKDLGERLLAKENVEILYNTVVDKFVGDPNLTNIKINNNGNKSDLEMDGVFVSIGMDSQTEVVDGLLNKNELDYIISEDGTTNVEGIFVAGDCRDKNVRQLTTATSDGTLVSSLVIKYLRK